MEIFFGHMRYAKGGRGGGDRERERVRESRVWNEHDIVESGAPVLLNAIFFTRIRHISWPQSSSYER